MQTIGFIGLGNMGNPMVKNLLQAGYSVMVYDIVPETIQALQAKGAVAAESIAELAKKSNVIFTMLQSGEQVEKVCIGKDGLFANAQTDALLIDTSSIDISTSRNLHQVAKNANLLLLDAPVSGGVRGAATATLTIMVGGDEAVFQRAKPILEKLGKNIVHAGPAGNGQAAKICNNMILGISMIAVSEAFTLADKLGLSAEKLFKISSKSSGQCWAMTSYSPVPGLVDNVPSNNDYKPGFTASMMLKDLKLSQDAASISHITTPLGSAATSLYQKFVESGNGNLDFSGIIDYIK